MRKSVDLLILNASELITLRGFSDKPAIRDDMKKLQIIRDGAVAIENG